MDEKNTYVIHDGIVYVVDNSDFTMEKSVEGSTFMATAKYKFKLSDVVSGIQSDALSNNYFPTFSGGKVIAQHMHSEDCRALCLEFEPSKRKTNFSNATFFGYSTTLAFPYVYLFMMVSDVSVRCYPYYRNTPIKSMDDNLCYSNLGNTDTSYRCMGGHYAEDQPSLNGKIGLAVHAFWDNEYNDTGLWDRATKCKNHPQTVDSWAFHSRLPNWKKYITSIEWEDSGRTVQQALYQMYGTYDDERNEENLIEIVVNDLFMRGKEFREEESWLR